jgi:DNA polymerase
MHDNCEKCRQYLHVKNPFLMGRGNFISPKVILVGMNPGKNEDEQGQVFVGRSGKILDEVVASFYPNTLIVNAVKCACVKDAKVGYRSGYRNPSNAEFELCNPILKSQLTDILIKNIKHLPLIVTLGKAATEAVLGPVKNNITNLAGHHHSVNIHGIRVSVVPLFHPSYILRNMSKKTTYLSKFADVFQMC